jgi:acyl carrier protein
MQNENWHDPRPTERTPRLAAEIQEWLIGRLAEELRVSREMVRIDRPIQSLGIDSAHMVSVVAQLEDWGGFRFSENPLDDYSTIEALSHHVAELTAK